MLKPRKKERGSQATVGQRYILNLNDYTKRKKTAAFRAIQFWFYLKQESGGEFFWDDM